MKRSKIIGTTFLVVLLIGVVMFGSVLLYAKLRPSVKASIGLNNNTIFRIDDLICTRAEFSALLYDKKAQYDALYGYELWNQDIGDISAKQFLKEQTLNQLAIYKCVRLLAEDKKVYLSDAQKDKAEKLAKKYMAKFTTSQIETMGISEAGVKSVYEEQLLFDKLFDALTLTVNEEISVDEARVIKIQYIYVDKDADNAKSKIDALYERVLAKDSFEKLAIDNNKETGYECQLARGLVEESFEDAAFNLNTDEVSGIITTTKGYYIVKCLNDYEKAATESNKKTILNNRKNAIFSDIYEEYVGKLYYEINDKAVEDYDFKSDFDVKARINSVE